MSCYENLVMKTQMNYSRNYSTYASGGTAVVLLSPFHRATAMVLSAQTAQANQHF